MATPCKLNPNDIFATSNSSMAYWDNYVTNYFLARQQTPEWIRRYIRMFYFQLVNRALGQLGADKNLRILKVDLWNEGVETSRDILGSLPSVEGVGFDFSNRICRLAKNRLRNVGITQAVCQNLPFDSGKFDLVLDLSTIDHIPFSGVSKIFAEYYRVLKPKGLLATAFWRSTFITKYFLCPHEDQFYFDEKKVACVLQENGFTIVSSYDVGSLLTLMESNFWFGQFVFWQLKRAFEDKLLTSVATFEQYFLNMMGGLHVFCARHP
ncbi:MAG: class I SAM-dependent methyltransferase [Candidatus Bathyarchaeota archaeon]|nr:class I SAM-dependent methyltransferase [Candidatus Bathyarchaeota archaeon]